MESAGGWYVTGPAGPVGPYDVEALRVGIAAGGITRATPVWCEGRSSWDALADVPELAQALADALVAAPTSSAAPAAPAAADGPPLAAAGGASRRGALAAAAPPEAADPMAAFSAEIAAIEAEAAEAEADGNGEGGPPTPEELEFEDDDGTAYVWDHSLRKYVPKGGSDAAAAAAAAAGGAYGIEAMTYAGDDEVLPTLDGAVAAVAAPATAEAAADAGAAERKRKRDAIVAEQREKMARREAAKNEQQQKGWFELKNNTSVYVTGLPFDTNEEEVATVFQKCGILKEGPDGLPRIKLYRNQEAGDLKGDALVTYLKAPSVQLATTLLDGAPLREGGKPMSVSEAKFEMKGGDYQAKEKAGGGGGGRGGGRGKRGRGGRGGGRSQLDRLERKLGWGGFDDRLPPEKVTVILSGMFDPRELEARLGAAQELEEDVATECKTFGPVEKLKVFKGHPSGVVSVRFRDEDGARACIARMEGRFFAGRRLSAALWDGVTNYNVKLKETEEEEAARLERYTRDLEAREAAEAAAAAAEAAAGAEM